MNAPRGRRGWAIPAAAWVAAFALGTGAGRAATNDLAALARFQERLGGLKTVQTDFRQEKRLALLERPMILEGRLALDDTGRLAWRVDKPVRYALVLTGDTMEQWDEDSGRVQRTPLARNPVLKTVAAQLRQWFGARYEDLARTYDVAAPTDSADTLVFTPRAAAPESAVIRRVTVRFRADGSYLSEVRIEETGGDWLRLAFTNTVLNAAIAPDRWEIAPHVR